jgi:hypothetical protein
LPNRSSNVNPAFFISRSAFLATASPINFCGVNRRAYPALI